MLVCRVGTELRCITQHDHGLLSGVLAHHLGPRLDSRLVLAVALHDFPWVGADAIPRWNATTGRPHTFVDFPRERRLSLYRTGLDELERIDPYVAALVSLHYTTFAGTRGLREFQEGERTRRRRLQQTHHAPTDAELGDALALLKHLDLLSLYLCLTSPDSDVDDVPPWLTASSAGRSPHGPLELTWTGANTLTVTPAVFGRNLTTSVRYRALPAELDSQADLDQAWRASELRQWTLSVRSH